MNDAHSDPSPSPTHRVSAESPCIKICLLDLDHRCRGCGRTIDEISRWSAMTMAERIAVNTRVGFFSHEHHR